MHPHISGFVVGVLSLGLGACGDELLQNEQSGQELCTDRWYWYVEAEIGVTDEHGHGPDIGSLEWKSAVEYKLGIRGNEGIPDPKTRDWCEYIQAVFAKSR